METQRWHPSDWIRLVALLGAFVAFGVGIWLLVSGVSAEGIVDLKSSVLSGTLKTASAGLFVCFFALIVIAFVLASLFVAKRSADARTPETRSRSRRMFPLFWGSILGIAGCGIAMLVVEPSVRVNLSFPMGLFGFGFAASLGAILRAINDGD